MELKKAYNINIINVNESLGYLIVVEKFNNDASKYYQNYYEKLLKFNNCGEWFENLEYNDIDTGKVVIVQTNKLTNVWARGIILSSNKNKLVPKIYLIDSQRFCDSESRLKMRSCPTKFLDLKLPTYHIDVNICFDDESVKNAIEILIYKNQCNELSFCFIPQSIHNNVYSGELIVINNTIDNSFVPLKKFLKNVHKNKHFLDISKKIEFIMYKSCLSNFQILENLIIPRDLNDINETESVVKNDYITNQNVSNENHLIESSIEKDFDCLSISSKFSDTEYQENNSIMTQETLEMNNSPAIIEKKSQPINFLADDSNVWWSSDDNDDENER